MATPNTVPALQQVARPLNLIPVGLKEAALDSPTFRATAVHFADQVELVEKWLDSYIKATLKLLGEVGVIEELVNTVIVRTVPPASISEAVFDHDYTLIASRRAAEGARELWSATILALRGTERRTVEPIKSFLQGELRNFKDARRYLDLTQKNYDSLLSRYASQSKAKEPSALREDAFQLHEARKQYLKASMDFCILAPQVRSTLDRLLIKIFSDQWQASRKASDSVAGTYNKWDQEMRRIKSWNLELELGEKVFRKELQGARKEIEEDAETKTRPSRELDDYATSTVPFLGSRSPGPPNRDVSPHADDAEKQGWLYLKTMSGKPARTAWVRKWFYVQSGIFGWLAQGSRTGGVEESDKIGVFLCNVKPAFQEDRRFCFEVKTKDSSMILQAETQAELTQWIAVFEAAKRKALEIASSAPSTPGARMNDSAFAISPPVNPEFAAHSEAPHDDMMSSSERSLTLPVPDREGTFGRSSFDTRRPGFNESDGARDHATRIIQKLDIHRKPSNPIPPPGPSPGLTSGGGIASLISASHTILPVHSTGITAQGSSGVSLASAAEMNLQSQLLGPGVSATPADMLASSLAPSTLANPPAATNMSKTAVIVGGGRGMASGSDTVPSGLMANLWGTHNWAYINRLESSKRNSEVVESPNSEEEKPLTLVASPDQIHPSNPLPLDTQPASSELTKQSQASGHRKTQSLDVGETRSKQPAAPAQYPSNYPLALKTQDAQFRMFFPEVPKEDTLLLVFRATWNPNGQQEFPGRVYVTSSALFFYSHHLGLVLVSMVSLGSIAEVKATPGQDADYLIFYLKEGSNKPGFTRIQVKVFLEPLRLLQRRLNLLIDEFGAENPLSAEELIDALLKLEKSSADRSPSLESWEDVSISTPLDGPGLGSPHFRHERDLRTAIHVDKSLHKQSHMPKEFTKFRLPSEPVVYEPKGMNRLAVERNFDISPKALFHIMFGDKSAIFQALYHERRAKHIRQGPWHSVEDGKMKRDFNYEVDQKTLFSKSKKMEIIDHQLIERMDDHLLYVIADEKTGWHLPHQEYFTLLTRIVITYETKSKCLLKIYTVVNWSKEPTFAKALVEKQALDDMDLEALDLADLVAEQVKRLGHRVPTQKAINIFGHVGQHKDFPLFPDAGMSSLPVDFRRPIKQRTLTNMVFEALGSWTETAVSSLMIWTFSAIRSIFRLFTIHRLLLGLLMWSAVANLFFSYRDSFSWWQERKVSHYMARLGVRPNNMMSRAIYLEDINALATFDTGTVANDTNECYQTFKNIVKLTDMDASHESHTLLAPISRATSRRLRLSRQTIGVQRHNLLVAIRVINRMESELMRAEWENWVLDENAHCEKVRWLLESQSPASPAGSNINATETKETDKDEGLLREWYNSYCVSCRAVLDTLSLNSVSSSI